MNIGEAHSVNLLLTFLLEPDQTTVEPEKARESAAYLAKRANTALKAGWTVDRVRAAWPEPAPLVAARGEVIPHGA